LKIAERHLIGIGSPVRVLLAKLSPPEKKVSDFGLSDNTKNMGYFAPDLLI
jgi:hypothetical protein